MEYLYKRLKYRTLSEDTRWSTPPRLQKRIDQVSKASTAFGPDRLARDVQNASTTCSQYRKAKHSDTHKQQIDRNKSKTRIERVAEKKRANNADRRPNYRTRVRGLQSALRNVDS